MADLEGVLICGELVDRRISTATKELLATGRSLGDELKQPVSLLLVGQVEEDTAQEAIALGADRVYLVADEPFSKSLPEQHLNFILEVYEQVMASIILFSHTDMGRDLAPRLAAKSDASVCLDCVGLSLDSNSHSLLQTKPVYGGNALAVWTSPPDKPRIVTMRPRSSPPAEPDESREGEIIPVKTDADDSPFKTELLEAGEEDVKGVKLEEAKVIVAGGGGIGGREGFEMLEELAQILGGAVGITRVPRDEGWMPSSQEIGQTGHVVSPDLYIAVGISGAPQHLAGCSGAKTIVAVNKDPQAHIFQEADFGIVGDYREAIPILIEQCRARLRA